VPLSTDLGRPDQQTSGPDLGEYGGIDPKQPARGARFTRLVEDPGGSKAFNRDEITDRLPPERRPRRPDHPGEFLGRLWSVFGPTLAADEGFEGYVIHDADSGCAFTAYSGASGPAYRAPDPHAAGLIGSLVAFERLLAEAPAADCAIEFDSDFGRVRIGVSGGKAFEETVAPPRVRSRATVETVEECLALVTPKRGDEMMEVLGFWPALYMTVVPALRRQRPSFDDLRADPTVARINAVFRENGELLIPIEDLLIVDLPRSGALWLEAYKRWRAARAA